MEKNVIHKTIKRPLYMLCLNMGILSTMFSTGFSSEIWKGTVVKVLTGDTLQVQYNSTLKEVHLWGIRAPQEPHPYAQRSIENLEILTQGNVINVSPYSPTYPQEHDENAVVFANVYLGEKCLNAHQVLEGLAWATPSFNTNRKFLLLELRAFSKRIGMWQTVAPPPPRPIFKKTN